MKKLFLITSAIFLFSCASSQNNETIIRGTIENKRTAGERYAVSKASIVLPTGWLCQGNCTQKYAVRNLNGKEATIAIFFIRMKPERARSIELFFDEMAKANNTTRTKTQNFYKGKTFSYAKSTLNGAYTVQDRPSHGVMFAQYKDNQLAGVVITAATDSDELFNLALKAYEDTYRIDW